MSIVADTGFVTAQPHVTVLTDRCAGCQECLIRCPTGALSLDTGTWTILADDAACVGCRQCVRTCPFAAITVTGPTLVAARGTLGVQHPEHLEGARTETRLGFTSWAQALAEADRCLACPDPTCIQGCPAHNDIPGFIGALSTGDLDAAQLILSATSVLPDICSRVCDQAMQCEGSCSWSLAGGTPVAIGALERFVTDNAPIPAVEQTTTRGDGLSVAIVGSGPAGISAAWELIAAGAHVTIYERDQAPGGMLRWGIPAFTVPAAVGRRPWEQLRAAGAELIVATDIDTAGIDKLRTAFDAVIICTGAGVSLKLAVPGAELSRVWDATRFLTQAGECLADGSGLAELDAIVAGTNRTATVLVLGAGNTAMDVARCARRIGARAICIDWMDRRFAPVRPDELTEAEAEGVDIRFQTTLDHLEGDGQNVHTAVLSRTRQNHAGERPKVLAGAALREPVDLVVMAMGYRLDPDLTGSYPGLPLRPADPALPDRRSLASGILAETEVAFARNQPVGHLAARRESSRELSALARAERTWVAGDALVGPSTVVEAMAQGAQAARAVLDHQPHRPASETQPWGSNVLLAIDTHTSRTTAAANQIADALRAYGLNPQTHPLHEVGVTELAWADLLIIGGRLERFGITGTDPTRTTRRWIAALPNLAGKPVALFTTYSLTAGASLTTLQAHLAAHGAHVVAVCALSRRNHTGSNNIVEATLRTLRVLPVATPRPTSWPFSS